MDPEITLMHLNRLIQICEDGKTGYRAAAEAIDIPGYQTMFLEIAQNRARFAEELRGEVLRLGEEPIDSGSMISPLHRAWINLRSAISMRDTYAILDECRRGDEAAIDEYQAVLATNMPTNLKEIAGQQVAEISQTLEKVNELAEARS